MAEVLPDGATKRDHLTVVWKASGQKPPELECEEPPAEAMHVWAWFQMMSRSERGNNGFSPLHLKSIDIEAWLRLRGFRPRTWEIEAINRIDIYYIAHLAEMAERERKAEDDSDAAKKAKEATHG